SGLGIAVLGVSFDTINKNVQYRDPDFIILKLLPILKNRSDFQCLIANTDDTLNYPFDIILGAPSKNPLLANMFPVDKAHKIIISFDTTNKSFSINIQPINYSTVSEDQEIINLKDEIATKYLVKQE
ncbi:MAG: hypothetical protein RMJ65_07205, partial [candidate division WOR-3 bacterium]|nr:hypothetical protein [candidate division WOR-3 bacterium]